MCQVLGAPRTCGAGRFQTMRTNSIWLRQQRATTNPGIEIRARRAHLVSTRQVKARSFGMELVPSSCETLQMSLCKHAYVRSATLCPSEINTGWRKSKTVYAHRAPRLLENTLGKNHFPSSHWFSGGHQAVGIAKRRAPPPTNHNQVCAVGVLTRACHGQRLRV